MSKPTASQILALAARQVGITESPAGSNNVKYNTWFYGRAVRGSVYAWCAAFISWLFGQFNALGLIFGKFARTDSKAKALRKSGRLIIGPGGLKKGDIVFFSFHGHKYQGRYLGIHHVGIYTGRRTADGRYITIEGNTSKSSDDNGGAVMIRYRAASSIAAHFSPAYAAEPKPTKKPVTTAAKPVYSIKTALKRGSRGASVKELQRALKKQGHYKGEVDGVFGPKTEAALKAFQKKRHMTVDGICGPKVASKLGWNWSAK